MQVKYRTTPREPDLLRSGGRGEICQVWLQSKQRQEPKRRLVTPMLGAAQLGFSLRGTVAQT